MSTRRAALVLAGLVLATACTSTGTGTPVETTVDGDATGATVRETIPPPPVDLTAGSAEADTLADHTWLGISVPGSDPDLLARAEADLGHRFELVRQFLRWDSDFPDERSARLLDEGRTLHVSVRARWEDGSFLRWRDIVEAEPDSAVDLGMRIWARRIGQLDRPVYVTFNHEPDLVENLPNGTPDEFVAAWRRFRQVFDDEGVTNARFVWILTPARFSDGTADDWFPGADAVDVLGVDPYNWFTCRGGGPWEELADKLQPFLDWSDRYPELALAVPGFGSAEDPGDPDRKGAWFRSAGAELEDKRFDRLEFAVLFSQVHPGGEFPDCDWRYDTSPAAQDGFAAMLESGRFTR